MEGGKRERGRGGVRREGSTFEKQGGGVGKNEKKGREIRGVRLTD